jgi:hypothetical protein
LKNPEKLLTGKADLLSEKTVTTIGRNAGFTSEQSPALFSMQTANRK